MSAGCPRCGAETGIHESLADGPPVPPVPGDFSVCLSCAAVRRFNPNMTLRLVTAEDLQPLPWSQVREIAAAKLSVEMFNESRTAPKAEA
jgi:hypothetical protein